MNRFKWLQGKHLGILIIYASNIVGERCAMWNIIIQFLPTNCRWIMTHDFNMGEISIDTFTSSCSHLMRLKEEFLWGDIKNIYDIEDFLSIVEGSIFSWNNWRMMSFMYLLDWVDFTCSQVWSKIHLPIFHIIGFLVVHRSLSTRPLGGSSWKANDKIFQEAKDHLKVLWDVLPPQMPFFTKLRKVVKYYKQLCIAKQLRLYLDETVLRNSLEFWQV